MKKQLKLSHFCKEYDISKSTAIELVHSKDFPGYKIGRCWYVDVDQFLKWRDLEHQRSYKYA